MEGEKKFRCDVDGKSFASQEELDRHNLVAHGAWREQGMRGEETQGKSARSEREKH